MSVAGRYSLGHGAVVLDFPRGSPARGWPRAQGLVRCGEVSAAELDDRALYVGGGLAKSQVQRIAMVVHELAALSPWEVGYPMVVRAFVECEWAVLLLVKVPACKAWRRTQLEAKSRRWAARPQEMQNVARELANGSEQRAWATSRRPCV